VFPHPIHNETVRRQQLERIQLLLDLQRQNPGIELLLTDFAFKTGYTLLPD
jgi:hypothetical protein